MNSRHQQTTGQKSAQQAAEQNITPSLADEPLDLQHPLAPSTMSDTALANLAVQIKSWGQALGFDAVGISDVDLSDAEAGLQAWLDAGYHGDMDYMEKHGTKRARPAELVPGTLRVVSVRMPYLPASLADAPCEAGLLSAGRAAADAATTSLSRAKPPARASGWRERQHRRLQMPDAAVISVYARGRDYHKVLRQRLQRLAQQIETQIGAFAYRVFTDSAPVMEVELARRAGVGWRGKHTLLLSRDAGSFFFIGELFVDVPLPVDAHASAYVNAPVTAPISSSIPADDGEHCGQCRRCIDACPTGAIVAPYRLDARKCISYLTIELQGSIPENLRPLIGNRIYGCDDCQTVCPWNKFAKVSTVPDFDTRNGLDNVSLMEVFAWSETEFERRFEGTAIRRIGHARWLRNVAVGLGNAVRAASSEDEGVAAIRVALQAKSQHADAMVREHVAWALACAPEAKQ